MAHFYEQTDKGVQPRHFVEMASRPGELRPTRITDVRKWWKNGQIVMPSVTTVLDSLNKHGLNNWRIDQHLIQAYKHHHLVDRPFDDYLSEVKRLTEIELDKAPSAGTDLHKLMEDFVNHELPSDHEMWEFCHKVYWEVECATGFKNDDGAGHYKTEQNFVSDEGYAGQLDLEISDVWIIDYKSKREAAKFKPRKMAYDEHAMQLAAYRRGRGLPKARCANVFVCLENGEVDFHEHSQEALDRGWAMFESVLRYWKIKNGFTEYLKAAA